MNRRLLLPVFMLAAAACGVDNDRSMTPPAPGQTAPTPATSAVDTVDNEGDVVGETSPIDVDDSLAVDSAVITSEDDDGAAGGRTASTDDVARSQPGRVETLPGGPGTALSPWPSPPPEGVMTTLFPVGFDMRLPWEDGDEIPDVYTCDASGVARSPLVSWFPPPRRTVELALVVTDEDAGGFVHWVAAGIEPALGALAPVNQPGGLVEAENDFGDVGWGAPCPPRNEDEHTYRFTLHAADERFDLEQGAPADEMIAEIEDTAFRSVSMTGVYER